MKKFIRNTNKYFLINKPIIWITAIPWVLATCIFVGLIQLFLGLIFPLSYNFSVIAYFVYLVLGTVCFMVGAFQFRNFETEFSFKQTFLIYLLNIATYLIFAFCILILSLTLHLRFKLSVKPENFGKELLAVRIGSLTDSEIDFIRRHPQLFTSKGSSTYYDTSRAVDLSEEYNSRLKIDSIPFSKSDISSKYSIVDALRYEKGFETVDSLLALNEAVMVKAPKNQLVYADNPKRSELDPDPIFYKYLSGLSAQQIDSIRKVKQRVLREYQISEHETGPWRKYTELSQQFASLIFNTSLPKDDEIALLILVIVLLSTLVFILVVTKSIATLMAIAMSIGIGLTAAYFISYSFELDGGEFIFGSALTLLLFIVTYSFVYKRKKITKIFIFHCINAAALCLILSVLVTSAPTLGKLPVIVAAIIITEYFFIRKMFHKMSFS